MGIYYDFSNANRLTEYFCRYDLPRTDLECLEQGNIAPILRQNVSGQCV